MTQRAEIFRRMLRLSPARGFVACRRARARTSIVCLLSSVVVASAANGAGAVNWIDIGGYIKSFAVAIDEPGIDVQGRAIGGDWLWANNNRFRANLSADAGEHLRFDASYEILVRIADDRLFTGDALVFFPQFPVYRFGDLKRTIWPDNFGAGDHVVLLQNLDRLYVTIAVPIGDLIVGRQAIAWGSAHAVNPTDVLAIFTYDEIDIEDRRGVDAMRMRIPVSALAEIDAGYVAGKDFEWASGAAYARSRLYIMQTDIALLAMAFRGNVMAGVDFARNFGGAGAWIEAAQVWADAADGRVPGSKDGDYLRLSAGAEYNFNVGNGLYTFVEYHYNGAGSAEPNDYIANVRRNDVAYGDGTVYLLGQHYIIPGLTYQLTPLAQLSMQSLVNITDGSLLLAPYLEYNLAENLYLSLGAFTAIGGGPRLQPAATADDALVLESEFGTYPTRYYMFMQFYY